MDRLNAGTFYIIFFLSGLLLFSSCIGENEEDILQEYFQINGLNPIETSSGLFYDIVMPGSGENVGADDFVTMIVTQFDLENNVIGTSDPRFPAALEVVSLSPALVEGVQLLRKGSVANFYIPPDLSAGVIQTGALVFRIEIVEIYDSLDDYNTKEIETYLSNEGLTAEITPEGIYYVIEEPGMDPKPMLSNEITVHYHGIFANGVVFDSSIDRGFPANFRLNEVIQGWQIGIPKFGVGGTGKLLIPSEYAYGEQGNANVPPNYPLIFDIELISIDN